jgi:hypothetical protein
MLQWLCGKLPWEYTDDPECIHFQKKGFMSCIPLLMLRCFLDSEPPAVLKQYFEHVASLGFETTPNYDYCRELLRQGIEDCGYVDDVKLVFVDNPLAGVIHSNDRGNKRKATEDPENIADLQPKVKKVCICPPLTPASIWTTRNSPTSSVPPSLQQFSKENIMPANPEKQVKKRAAVARKLRTNIGDNLEGVSMLKVSEPTKSGRQRASKSPVNNPTPAMLKIMSKMRHKIRDNLERASLLEVSEPTKPGHKTAYKSPVSNPTLAMLEIMLKMRQKPSTSAARRGGKFGRLRRSNRRGMETACGGIRLRDKVPTKGQCSCRR